MPSLLELLMPALIHPIYVRWCYQKPSMKWKSWWQALAEILKQFLTIAVLVIFSLTALNDLSRNRTLGLLIGKGFFFSQDISQKVVLEGRIAVNIFYDQLQAKGISEEEYPLMGELYKVFNTTYDTGKFVNNILKSHKSYWVARPWPLLSFFAQNGCYQ